MEERMRPTRSGLFAIELLIAVGVFVCCAVICLGVFVRAEVMSTDNAARENALVLAENTVECWKSVGGDLTETATLCGGAVENGALAVTDGALALSLTPRSSEGYALAEVRVLYAGDELLCWTVAAMEVAP